MGIDREVWRIVDGVGPGRGDYDGDIPHGDSCGKPRKPTRAEVQAATAKLTRDQMRIVRDQEMANAGIDCEWSAVWLYAIFGGFASIAMAAWLVWIFASIGVWALFFVVAVALVARSIWIDNVGGGE